MSRRGRILSFGTAGALVLAGAACGVAITGTLGQVLLFVLISVGLVLATALVFLEVGLSEDRERASMQQRPARPPMTGSQPRPRRRLPRSDGHRRRL